MFLQDPYTQGHHLTPGSQFSRLKKKFRSDFQNTPKPAAMFAVSDTDVCDADKRGAIKKMGVHLNFPLSSEVS